MNLFQERRKRALDAFAGGVAVIPAAREVIRNNDNAYDFRQHSDFFYLTGFDEPDAVLVLAPDHPEVRCVLFVRERDREMEIWNGRRVGVERAPEMLGVDRAYAIESIDEHLPDLLTGVDTLYFALDESGLDRTIMDALKTAQSRTRRQGRAPAVIADPRPTIHAMRQIKSAPEIAIMRRSAEISGLGHIAAMKATRPGAYEYEIEAVLEFEFKRRGARRLAYQSIVAGGDNATILHYHENRDRLEDGALLLIDAACEYEYYATDITRTWPVNGRFSPEQRAIYEIVLRAQEAACAQVQPGLSQRAFHHAAVRVITEGLLDIGLLQGSVDENIERETYRAYYMHGTGHWLGMDVHDVGRYRDERDEPVALAPGMVTTVEPGIYVQRDAHCDERFRGIGVRIEDDLLVTADGHENLTERVPKTIDAVEAIVGTEALTAARS